MIRLLVFWGLCACHAAPRPPQPTPSLGADTTLAAATRLWKTLPTTDLDTRLDWASRALMGRRYLLGPLGEGDSTIGEAKPRLRMDAFDCVTYMETALALAVSRDSTAILSQMDSIRYRVGQALWRERNHFFEGEWLPRNQRYARLAAFPDDTVEYRLLLRKGFYAKRGVDVNDTAIAVRMTPRERAIARWSHPSDTTRIRGVGFVGKVVGYPVLHTGFLVERTGMPPFLRHASQAGTVREQPMAEYLREKPKFVGVMVWDWLP